MRVLIVGSGIAGLTVAYWLREYGIQVTAIEKVAQFRPIGSIAVLREDASVYYPSTREITFNRHIYDGGKQTLSSNETPALCVYATTISTTATKTTSSRSLTLRGVKAVVVPVQRFCSSNAPWHYFALRHL